jgi:hypothetical protein
VGFIGVPVENGLGGSEVAAGVGLGGCDGGCAEGSGYGGRRDQTSLLSFFRFVRIQTRQGCP